MKKNSLNYNIKSIINQMNNISGSYINNFLSIKNTANSGVKL